MLAEINISQNKYQVILRRKKMFKIVEFNFDGSDFYSYDRTVKELNQVINTWFCPSGQSLLEVLFNFHKIQSSRRLGDSVLGNANLRLQYDEESIRIEYYSLSNTYIDIEFILNHVDKSQVMMIHIAVYLPENRVGGHAYNNLMERYHKYNWITNDFQINDFQIKVPDSILSLNPEFEGEIVIPNFVYHELSNYENSVYNKERLANPFKEFGYEEVELVGFVRSWYNKEKNEYIVESNIPVFENRLSIIRRKRRKTNQLVFNEKQKSSSKTVLENLQSRKEFDEKICDENYEDDGMYQDTEVLED